MADVRLAKSFAEPLDPQDEFSRQQAVDLFQQLVASDKQLDGESIGHLLNDNLPLGLLLDLLTFSSGASLDDQQKILETLDVAHRAGKVIEILQSRLATMHQPLLQFPPMFSNN